MGRAFKRLVLMSDRRRVFGKAEYILDVVKAKKKLKIIKGEEKCQQNQ